MSLTDAILSAVRAELARRRVALDSDADLRSVTVEVHLTGGQGSIRAVIIRPISEHRYAGAADSQPLSASSP